MLNSLLSYFAPAPVSSDGNDSLSSPCVLVDAESLAESPGGSGTEGELMVTPYGVGRLERYESGGIVRVRLEWGTAFLHLSCLAPLQLVHCSQMGYVARNPDTDQFEKVQPWGVAVLDPASSTVEPIYSYAESRRIPVRTPLGSGQLTGHARPDGFVAVDLQWCKLYTRIERVQLGEEKTATSSSTHTSTQAQASTQAQQTQTPAKAQQQAHTQTAAQSKDSSPSSTSRLSPQLAALTRERDRSRSPNSANSDSSSGGSASSGGGKSGPSVTKQRFRPGKKGRK